MLSALTLPVSWCDRHKWLTFPRVSTKNLMSWENSQFLASWDSWSPIKPLSGNMIWNSEAGKRSLGPAH